MVNGEGETLADVLITNGVIEAVSASLTVRNVREFQLGSVLHVHASALTSSISAFNGGCKSNDVVLASWFGGWRNVLVVLLLCLHAS